MATVLSAFRVVAVATAAWFVALLVATGLVYGLLGDVGAFWINTLLMGALAALSGPLLVREMRRSVPGRERGEWTAAELVYAIVFVLSAFIFANSAAYLFYAA
jgi:hypothetical protein